MLQSLSELGDHYRNGTMTFALLKQLLVKKILLKPPNDKLLMQGITLHMRPVLMQAQGAEDPEFSIQKSKMLRNFWDKMDNVQGRHLGLLENIKDLHKSIKVEAEAFHTFNLDLIKAVIKN